MNKSFDAISAIVNYNLTVSENNKAEEKRKAEAKAAEKENEIARALALHKAATASADKAVISSNSVLKGLAGQSKADKPVITLEGTTSRITDSLKKLEALKSIDEPAFYVLQELGIL